MVARRGQESASTATTAVAMERTSTPRKIRRWRSFMAWAGSGMLPI
jgi:hypothetical protein